MSWNVRFEPALNQTTFYITDDSRCERTGGILKGQYPTGSARHEANVKLIVAAPRLLSALKDLLGDQPQVQGGICQHCGRDYIGDIDMLTADCPSDDCPAHIAQKLINEIEGQ